MQISKGGYILKGCKYPRDAVEVGGGGSTDPSGSSKVVLLG
jgi:hypothetical protein